MSKKRPFAVRQGEIYYVDFPETAGSVQKGIRPVVITQNNRLNKNSTTYVCALITSKLKRLDLPEHVLLPEIKGLPKRSMVMAEQRETVDREQLIEYRGKVGWITFKDIHHAIRKCEEISERNYHK